jgi:poly[(R)-3-hydroxyalkanoate] polymerase subunit PhaC
LLPHSRFVVSSSGHVAGIVNPPGPKPRYWTNDALPDDPQAWLAAAVSHPGSWWQDWATWVAERSGPLGPPPAMGSPRYGPLVDAPGAYVHGK